MGNPQITALESAGDHVSIALEIRVVLVIFMRRFFLSGLPQQGKRDRTGYWNCFSVVLMYHRLRCRTCGLVPMK